MAITGLFDVLIVSSMMQQARTYGYEPAAATVIRSEVKSSQGARSTQYSPDITYTYVAGGISYTNNVVRYSAMESTSVPHESQRFVSAYPAGASVTAHFDTARPARAVLDRGLNGSELFLLLFLTPFNMVGLGLAWLIRETWRTHKSALGGYAYTDSAQGFVVSVGHRPILIVAIMSFGLSAGITTLLVAFGTGAGFDPPTSVMLWAWPIVFALTLASVVWNFVYNQLGQGDLEVDFLHQELTVPAGEHSWARRTFALEDAQAVILRRMVVVGSKGGAPNEFHYFAEFRMRHTEERVIIGQTYAEDSAFRLVEWLARRMGLPMEVDFDDAE